MTYQYKPLLGVNLPATGSIGGWAYGINSSGQIVGTYAVTVGQTNFNHGFLVSNGVYSTVDFPSAATTFAYGNNDGGQIVGAYQDGAGTTHGFLKSGNTFVTIDDPLGIFGTVALGINNAGQVVGNYTDASGTHGFLYGSGSYTTLNDPLATSSSSANNGTSAYAINNAGQIVGRYFDASGYHGFLYSGGTYTTLNDPLQTSNTTAAYGINDAGQITGTYLSGDFHGFLYSGGTYTNIDYPGGTPGAGSVVEKINNAGQIVGYYDLDFLVGEVLGTPFVATPGVTSSGLLSSLSLDQQTELIYVGYFNRSADGGGFGFWEGQNTSAQAAGQSAAVALTNIANSFTPQPETAALYPFLNNPNPNFSDPTVQAGLTSFMKPKGGKPGRIRDAKAAPAKRRLIRRRIAT